MHIIIELEQALRSFITKKYNITDQTILSTCQFTINTQQTKAHFGDLSSTAPLHIAQYLHNTPHAIGTEITNEFTHAYIEKITCAGVGFINISLHHDAFITITQQLFKNQKDYISQLFPEKQRIIIEFVSANPTGPLHFGHGRNGIIGDILSNVLRFIGHSVTKEFYVNDAGRQMQKLATSLLIRCQQQLGIEATLPADGYQGDYLEKIAKSCINEYSTKVLEKPESFFAEYAKEKILINIKETLKKYNITFDSFFFETTLHQNDSINRLISLLIKKGLAYEDEGALWFSSSEFEDDKDRVIRKTNGELTYLAADIAYLKNKAERGYDRFIMVLGHDHHSFAIRLQAIKKALELRPELDIILYQLVKIKEGSEQVKMSKRSGKMVFLEDVIDTVGTDTARFFYSNRKAEAQLEFNLDLALQKNEANPLFYIQYALVRIKSIIKKSGTITDLINITNQDATALTSSEYRLIKKILEFGKILQHINLNLQPHLLTSYTLELAQEFHSYYTHNHIINPENIPLSRARLFLLIILHTTIEYCLDLIGISKPEHM